MPVGAGLKLYQIFDRRIAVFSTRTWNAVCIKMLTFTPGPSLTGSKLAW